MFVNEAGESVSRPVEATIGVVEDIIDRRNKDSLRKKPILFSYTLSPKANGMLSQLACRLDGIHVDLERELGKGGIQTHVRILLP